MHIRAACEALASGKRLELRYDGYSRVVEVHVTGYSREGNALMRVWQVRGGSESGEPIGWKLMRLDESFSGQIINEKSVAPRPGYKRDDAAMKGGIKCQL
jgi:YD repeat-containing protein